jgi:hypothetical protein
MRQNFNTKVRVSKYARRNSRTGMELAIDKQNSYGRPKSTRFDVDIVEWKAGQQVVVRSRGMRQTITLFGQIPQAPRLSREQAIEKLSKQQLAALALGQSTYVGASRVRTLDEAVATVQAQSGGGVQAGGLRTVTRANPELVQRLGFTPVAAKFGR